MLIYIYIDIHIHIVHIYKHICHKLYIYVYVKYDVALLTQAIRSHSTTLFMFFSSHYGEHMGGLKRTVVARAQEAAKSQTKWQSEADYQIMCFSLKSNPEAIQSVKGHMRSNGWWGEQGFLSAQESVEPKKPKITADDGDESPDLSKRPCLQMSIHQHFVSWDSVPPQDLRVLIESVEPVSLQRAALMGKFRAVGQREVPMTKLMPLAERMVGLDPSEDIGNERRLWCIAMAWRQISMNPMDALCNVLCCPLIGTHMELSYFI